MPRLSFGKNDFHRVRRVVVKTALAALEVLAADIYGMLRCVNKDHMKTLSTNYQR